MLQMRRLRQVAGLSQEEAAERMGWNRSKLHRLEFGRNQKIKASDVIALCRLYGVSDAETDALADLARQSGKRSWWHRYSDILPGPYIGLEAEATTIREYEVTLVPGLLQTEDYIRQILRHSAGSSEDEIERRVTVRLERQKILTRPDSPPRLWAILDESVIRREVGGPEVMKAQIQHLIDMSRLPNVDIQILRFSVGAHAGVAGSFVILDFSGMDQVVYIETDRDGFYLEDTDEVERYRLVYDKIQAAAGSTESTIAFLEDVLSEM
ncbi:Predicted transcriptional regulators [Marinactinospora thermotolerans DSM 45154]|uniref:Predicted transcriptional regulators n=1 Tax=Marinactinospora thermotolerans DSM 45154 TaxID=1122192 RepID=A0A1T4TCX8_9ACTN|nr:helix-turn-helix transcriptional regulator [Marinactinospora thermotolerans]SKA38236.1 Predicted transcriptional regulators [Marinactinospora thermotolerans DSM 45154]